MDNKFINWLLFIGLSFIWGSSFILIKGGLLHLTPYQVASIRIISSGVVLLPVAVLNIRQIPSGKLGIIFLSGVLGSLIPAYLFCLAEQGIDSSLAGTLNSLTPIFVIIAGGLFFSTKTPFNKIWGILLAFCGSLMLFFSQPNFSENNNLVYILFVVLATALYGINVNMVHKYLGNIGSLKIASVGLGLSAIPAAAVLYFTGYFGQDLSQKDILISTGYSALLGVFGTAIATVLFYILLKRAGAVFASMVTYGIPAVAIFWGIVYGEQVGWKQALSVFVILAGVWVTNRKPKEIV
ncbi:MAG: DMT family transporter [Gloeobacteraceae cyanobacterium ES-bin-316]|nr:DMT family transporter [Ferruginibacter sp.]